MNFQPELPLWRGGEQQEKVRATEATTTKKASVGAVALDY